MSAARLREAAALMRSRAEAATPGPWRDLHPVVALAVADWLDTAGADIWAHGPLCECGTGCDACDDNLWEPHARAALAVADAYLGGRNE